MSLRTLYRDIEALKAQGARIEGEAGFGYVLKPGFTLPPLMFSLEEVEALALGARWVEGRADEGLTKAARGALAKIAAVLPPERAEALDWPTMLAGAGARATAGAPQPAADPRGARGRAQAQARLCRQGRALLGPGRLAGRARLLRPRRGCSPPGARRARPSAISASTGWTEVAVLDERPPKARRTLLLDWRRAEGLDA